VNSIASSFQTLMESRLYKFDVEFQQRDKPVNLIISLASMGSITVCIALHLSFFNFQQGDKSTNLMFCLLLRKIFP